MNSPQRIPSRLQQRRAAAEPAGEEVVDVGEDVRHRAAAPENGVDRPEAGIPDRHRHAPPVDLVAFRDSPHDPLVQGKAEEFHFFDHPGADRSRAHVAAGRARAAERLLQAAPQLKIIATGREGLGIEGEKSYPVPSLSLSDTRHPTAASR